MANVFGILAALVLAAAAYFGMVNKKALIDQESVRASEEMRLDQNNETFKDLTSKFNGLEEDTKVATEENVALTEKLEAQLATNKSLDVEISDKRDAAETKKTRVTEGKEKLVKFGNLDDLKRNLEQLRTDLATLNGELLLKDNEINSRTDLNKSLNTENENLSMVLGNYAKKQSSPNLRASVTRVVSDLGFVIISGGDNAGIVRDSILEVQRGGETIGKLEVSGTEPSTAAASIIPDSFQEGMRVRVGDTVVAASK